MNKNSSWKDLNGLSEHVFKGFGVYFKKIFVYGSENYKYKEHGKRKNIRLFAGVHLGPSLPTLLATCIICMLREERVRENEGGLISLYPLGGWGKTEWATSMSIFPQRYDWCCICCPCWKRKHEALAVQWCCPCYDVVRATMLSVLRYCLWYDVVHATMLSVLGCCTCYGVVRATVLSVLRCCLCCDVVPATMLSVLRCMCPYYDVVRATMLPMLRCCPSYDVVRAKIESRKYQHDWLYLQSINSNKHQ